jgi:hypothetical protein
LHLRLVLQRFPALAPLDAAKATDRADVQMAVPIDPEALVSPLYVTQLYGTLSSLIAQALAAPVEPSGPKLVVPGIAQ